MKKLHVTLLVILPIVASAMDQSALAFPDQKIGLPPLSLTEISQQNPPSVVNFADAWFRSRSQAVVAAKRFVSKMPILSVKGDLDTKMLKAPDALTDYKMIVKVPEVESTK